MKNLTLFLMLLISYTAFAQGNTYMAGHVLVTFKHEVKHKEPASTAFGIATLDEINNRYQCTSVKALKRSTDGYGGVYQLNSPEMTDIPALITAYEGTGIFKSVSPDYIGSIAAMPNDSLFYKQWGLNNDGNPIDGKPKKAGADIDMLRAWEVEDGNSSVIMAILDAGLKLDHPEFEDRLWKNTLDTPGNNIDDDGNGYVDDTVGWNFIADSLNVADDHGHGTFVAGILGANVNNTTGYAGVDQHCKLMVCKTADYQGFVPYGSLIGGIYYAVDNGANVINISAGGTMTIPELVDAVVYAYSHNVSIVAASGNNGSSIKWYPAGYKQVISVGATGPLDTVAKFSNYGDHLSVVAPGDWIYGLSYLNDTSSTDVSYGTSFAAPHVAGIASLLIAQDKSRTPEQVKQLIQSNAEDMVGSERDLPGWDKYYGYGRVNAYRTLTNAALQISTDRKTDELKIFPVPAKDRLYLNGPGLRGSDITISSVLGTVVYNARAEQVIHAVNLSNYTPGTYIVTVQKENEKISREITVLQ